MFWLLIIACFIGIYDGFEQLNLIKNGLKPGIRPSKNLVSYLFLDKLD